MFDAFDFQSKGSIVLIVMAILSIFVSGLFFGISYYTMDVTETAFRSSDCVINNNVYVSSCQELWELSVYPFFALKELLVWMSFFFIFALVIGMLLLGYKSGKSPVLLGLLITFIIVLTYMGIEISNIYRTMINIDMFRQMMVEFTVYNKIMINFPWFVFIIGLMSLLLSIVNYQRTKVNKVAELDY